MREWRVGLVVVALAGACAVPGGAGFSVRQAATTDLRLDNPKAGHYQVSLKRPDDRAIVPLGGVVWDGQAAEVTAWDHPGFGDFKAQLSDGALQIQLGLPEGQKGQVIVSRPLGDWSTRDFMGLVDLDEAPILARGAIRGLFAWMEKENLLDIRQPISETVMTKDL